MLDLLGRGYNMAGATNNVFISDICYYLPDAVEENISLQKDFPNRIDDKYIDTLGVKFRHIAPWDMKPSELALKAGEKFFEETAFNKNDIDALIYTSVDHDYIAPSVSCVLQHKLGLKTSIATYDIHNGCSAYVYGLSLAKGIMLGMNMDNVLFIASSVASRHMYPKNLSVRLLFGDASTATLISRAKNTGDGNIGEFVFGTDGAGYQKIIVREWGELEPPETSPFPEKSDQFGNVFTDNSLYMDGPGILLFMLKRVPKLIEETLLKNNLEEKDIDLFVLHQANYFALETIRKKMGIAPDRFFYSMEKTGNTIQATIPIALREAMNAGKINKGSKVLLAAFGSGLSWAATVATF